MIELYLQLQKEDVGFEIIFVLPGLHFDVSFHHMNVIGIVSENKWRMESEFLEISTANLSMLELMISATLGCKAAKETPTHSRSLISSDEDQLDSQMTATLSRNRKIGKRNFFKKPKHGRVDCWLIFSHEMTSELGGTAIKPKQLCLLPFYVFFSSALALQPLLETAISKNCFCSGLYWPLCASDVKVSYSDCLFIKYRLLLSADFL